MSLYWATATTTTVGYGDIRAHTHLERGYATIIMIFGVMAYGYLIASVAASLVNADSARASHQSKLNAVKSYLKVTQGVLLTYDLLMHSIGRITKFRNLL